MSNDQAALLGELDEFPDFFDYLSYDIPCGNG